MRNIAGRISIIIVLFIAAANLSMIGVKRSSGANNIDFTRNLHSHPSFQDTIPPKPEKPPEKVPKKIEIPKVPKLELPKVPPLKIPKKADGLLKLLGNLFKFKKHANENEKNRVAKYINELGLKDSIAATELNAKLLIYGLTDTINQNIDSLRNLIKYIQEKEQNLFANQQDIESVQSDLDEKFSKLDNFIRINKDKYASKDISDKDLNILASKIFPIIAVTADIKLVSEKMARLKILGNIRDSAQYLRSLKDTNGRQIDYYVKTKNKIDVYGFYNQFTGTSVQADKFGYLNTFIYNSVFINSQTGDIKYMNGWDTSSIVTLAQNAKCKIAVTFTLDGEKGQDDFLSNHLSQGTFINTAIYLMKFRNASAINISFNKISFAQSSNFTGFIKKLFSKLKQKDTAYKLFLTIPATTTGNYYTLPELAVVSDRFILDFSKNFNTIASPMASITALTDVITFFVKAKVSPSKIVVCLPYKGAQWAINNPYGDKFIEYIDYSTIRKNYLFPGYINYLVDSTATAVMDYTGNNILPVKRIYYDDETTIGLKYDFILKNEIGGVAVNGLGDDFGYSGLWDEMAYAFAMPDTNVVNGIPVKPMVKTPGLNFFQRMYRQFYLYAHIVQRPCEFCFDNITDTEEKNKINQYLLDLDIDSQMDSANILHKKNGEDTFRSRFEFVTYQLRVLLKKVNLVILIILLILGILYVYKVKNLGNKWSWKKRVGRILIGVSVLFIFSTFTYFFTRHDIPFFGVSESENITGYSKAYLNNTKLPEIIANSDTSYCVYDPNTKCVSMPLLTLLMIIVIVLTVGYLLTRYLVLPMISRDVVP